MDWLENNKKEQHEFKNLSFATLHAHDLRNAWDYVYGCIKQIEKNPNSHWTRPWMNKDNLQFIKDTQA